MVEPTVVFFCVEKEGCGRIKRRGKWQYSIEESYVPCIFPVEAGADSRIKQLIVHLPAYSYKKKEWTEDTLQSYLQGLAVPPESREVYYLYQEKAGELLHRRAEPLPVEWLFLLLSHYQIMFDALIVLHERELETEKLVTKYVKNTRYIGIVTQDAEEFAALKEMLLEEYGFLLDIASDIRRLCRPAAAETLIIAGENLYGITPARMPAECVWLSTDSTGSEVRKLCSRARDVRYVDVKTLISITLRT
ncbi:MAG: hypothetical protein ACI4TB_07395 [Lachnospiraceae bacterium]